MHCKSFPTHAIRQFIFFNDLRFRTSANGLLKTMHTGVDTYRKTRADGHVTLSKPHVTFLGASNGVSRIEFRFFSNFINNYVLLILLRTLLSKLFDKSSKVSMFRMLWLNDSSGKL